jgi:acetyltransferase-like isoleucine patch superfamily enzyme
LARLRLRLLDRAADLVHAPNRIDPDASVSRLAWVRGSNIRGPVSVGDHARIYRAELSGPIAIGTSTSLWGPRIYMHARVDPVEIGSFCSIGRDVSIHGFGHDSRRISTHYVGRNVLGLSIDQEVVTSGPTRIGHDVWVGAGVHVLGGVTIGTGAVIGAGSVVSRDVPPYAIAVGAPAVPARYRFDERTIERLLASDWWTWRPEEIQDRAELFGAPLSEELVEKYL